MKRFDGVQPLRTGTTTPGLDSDDNETSDTNETRETTSGDSPWDASSGGALESPPYEEVPVLNILPSYQLYQSTFSKNILPSNDDPRFDPPHYEHVTPTPSRDTNPSSEYFPLVSPESEVDPAALASDSPTEWRDTILANTHKLTKLEDCDYALSEKLRITVQLTKNPCKVGVRPVILEHNNLEFQQGDPVHGFVTITNLADIPLPFDMFSVLLEGKASVLGEGSEGRKPLVLFKFLNMFDYTASWTPASLLGDTDGPLVDPLDNTHQTLPANKIFEPSITYKKFFNFTVPERLLDCACDSHNLQQHCALIPTIGLARDQFLKNLRRMRERNGGPKPDKSTFSLAESPESTGAIKRKGLQGVIQPRIKDYSFSDTAVSYSVEARVIGRSSHYARLSNKAKNLPQKEEFVMVNETSCFIRVIPYEQLSYQFDTSALDKQSQVLYRNILRRMAQIIDLGKALISEEKTLPRAVESKNYEIARASSMAKRKQLYMRSVPFPTVNSPHTTLDGSENYEIVYPLKKKFLTAAPKIMGVIQVSTPKIEYKIKYLAPHNFKTVNYYVPMEELPTKFEVPIDLTLNLSNEVGIKSLKLPEIKSVTAELVAVTYRSRKYTIPIEMTHDLVFQNKLGDNDNMEGILIKPFKQNLLEIADLTKKLSAELLSVDSQLVMDMKCLAFLQVKHNALKIENTKLHCKNGSVSWDSGPSSCIHTKSIVVSVDLTSLLGKEVGSQEEVSSEAQALVPSFQSCFLGRSYYINITIKLNNSDNLAIKVPVKIQH